MRRAQARDYIRSRESVSERNVGLGEGTWVLTSRRPQVGLGPEPGSVPTPPAGEAWEGGGGQRDGFQEGSGLTSPLPIPLSPPKWARSPFPGPLCHQGGVRPEPVPNSGSGEQGECYFSHRPPNPDGQNLK